MNAPLDFDRLADVLRGSGLSQGDFLARFRLLTELDSRQLHEAIGTGHLARVAQLAHRIEGSCQVIGARPLAAACGALSHAAGLGRTACLLSTCAVFFECKQALYAVIDAADGTVSQSPVMQDATARTEEPPICAGHAFWVVEDHDFQRNVTMRLLRKLGAEDVRGFADGAAALAAARSLAEPAVVLLDLAMPGPDGLEVVRLAAQERLPMAVILHSALSEGLLRGPLQTARSYGGQVLGSVSKPLTAGKLAPLLAGLERHGYAGTAIAARAT